MKVLLALALLAALLAIGNTAAACPLGVCMGDPIKPLEGWDAQGLGIELRPYKGTLPFEVILIKGLRKGGACTSAAAGRASSRDNALRQYKKLRKLLVDKYGKPDKEEPKPGLFGRPSSSEDPESWWFQESNSDKIEELSLTVFREKSGTHLDNYVFRLQYFFENIAECEKLEAGDL